MTTETFGQHTSSIAHRMTLEAGGTVRSVHNFGEGDNQVTVVFYNEKELKPQMFDNAGAKTIEKLDEDGKRVKIGGEWHELP